MNNTLSKIVIFAAGAAFGSAVTCNYFKKKYEQIAQEKIESYKEAKSRREQETEETQPDKNPPEMTKEEYGQMVEDLGYDTRSKVEEAEDDTIRPYVIAPEEFGEFKNYETIELRCYADGVLTDDEDELVEDVAGTVGLDFEEHFGEYEMDAVHIRNDERRCDYEILRDIRTYKEVHPPHNTEG